MAFPRRALITCAVPAIIACAPVATEPDVALGVVATSTTVSRDALGFADFGFQVLNSGIRPVYLPRCGAQVTAIVDARTPTATWTVVLDGTLGCYSSLALGPLRLAAGQSVRGVLRARTSAGIHRVRVSAATDSLQRNTVLIASEPITVK